MTKLLKNKQEKGITLIALVVTIIVLLILAGISIAMLTGQNGILNRAAEARDLTGTAQTDESVKIAVGGAFAKGLGTISYKDLNDELKEKFGEGNYTISPKDDSQKKWTVEVNNSKYTIESNGKITIGAGSVEEPTEDDPTGSKLTDSEKEALTAQNNSNPSDPIAEITPTNNNLKDESKIKAVLTGEVPIPVDGEYLEGTKDTGVVIRYKKSEFVWVPVPVAVKSDSMPAGAKPMAKVAEVNGYASTTQGVTNYEGVLYDYSGSGTSTSSSEQTTYGQHATNKKQHREPDIVTDYDSDSKDYLKNIGYEKDGKSDPDAFKADLIKEYRLMVESVAKYGGFYVGRYETSLDSSTVVASKKSTAEKEIKPMTDKTNSGNMWYGMYDKQKKFSGIDSETGEPNNDKLQSSMIWGSQYDAMLNWMILGADKAKVRQTGNANHNYGSPQPTGAETRDKINNVYDLEGNVYELTQEAYYPSYRASRRTLLRQPRLQRLPSGSRQIPSGQHLRLRWVSPCTLHKVGLNSKGDK